MTSVQDVISVLQDSGYEQLPTPLRVAGTEFDFQAAALGLHSSHDLVLIATNQIPHLRLHRLVAGVARSLDLAASRRPMSLVLVGEVAISDRMELERYARVLPIASGEPTIAEIEDAIAILLPLKLPTASLMHGSDPVNEVLGVLGPAKSTRAHLTFLEAASDGPEGVREVLRRYLNEGAGWTDGVEDDDE